MPSPIASLFVGVGADISGALKGLSTLQDKVQSAASSLESVGGTLTKSITVPIVGAAVAVGAIGIGFESAFVAVRKTVDETTTDLDALEAGIVNLSKTSAGAGKSAEELAGIASVAGQLGVEGAANILKLTSVVAGFSLATGIAAEQAAADLEAIRILTRTPREEFENLANTIVDLGNRTAATESEIIELTNRLAGSLSAVGVSAQDILGIAAAMASLKINPEAGGTAVSKMFVEMAAAAEGASGKLKDNGKAIREQQDRLTDLQGSLAGAQERQQAFGRNTPAATVKTTADAVARYQREIAEAKADLDKLNGAQGTAAGGIEQFAKVANMPVEAFRDLIRTDPSKAFVSIVKGIAGIRDAQGPGAALAAMADLGIDDTRMREAILKLSTDSDLLTKSMDIGADAWQKNNASQEEARKALESTENQFKLLVNEIKADFIPLWKNELRPIVLQVGQAFREHILPAIKGMVSAFSDMSPEQQKNALFWAAIAAAAGPALVVLGLVVGVLGALLSPIGLVVLAVAGLAAAWATNFGDIQGKTQAVMDKVGEFIAGAGLLWEQHGPGLVATATDVFEKVKGVVGAAFSWFGTLWDLQIAIADRALREIAAFFTTILLPAFKSIGGWIGEHVLGPFVQLLKDIQAIMDTLFPQGAGMSEANLKFLKSQGITNDLGATGGSAAGLFGSAIAAGEAALNKMTADIAAGGPNAKTFNAPLVAVYNPVITDQASLDELVGRVGSWVTTALVKSEAESSMPPMQAVPGVPF